MTSAAQRKTVLSMSAAPVVSAGAGALAGCLSGGLFAGGLHAIAGKFACTYALIFFLARIGVCSVREPL